MPNNSITVSKDFPKISIITINYNQKMELRETIESIVSQNYPNLEYIIIDGGSTDGSVEVIKEYEAAITYWVSEEDDGIYCALNKGLKQVTGDWFNFMNAGDYFTNNNSLFEFIAHLDDKYTIVYSDFFYLQENDAKQNFKQKGLFKYNVLLNTLNHQSIFFNTAKAKDIEYDPEFEIAADLDLILKIHLKYGKKGFHHIKDKCLITYRPGGISSQKKDVLLAERRRVIKKLPFPQNYLSLLYHYYRKY